MRDDGLDGAGAHGELLSSLDSGRDGWYPGAVAPKCFSIIAEYLRIVKSGHYAY